MKTQKYTIYNINEKGRVTISSLCCSLEELWNRVSDYVSEDSSTTIYANGKEVITIG